MALTKITRGVIKANENYDTHNINSTGIVTAVSANFTGNVSIGGTLTYQDVTNIDSVGIITAQSDISIADKIVHTGDTNTALRFPAADTITAETGGTERLRIKSDGKAYFSGNLGLGGQTSPGAPIHLHNFGNDGYELKITGNAVQFNRSSNSYIDQLHNSGSILFRMTSSNTEAMRITSAGRVGVNNSSPNTVLHIKSTQNSDGLTVTKGSNVSAFLGHNGSGDEGLFTLKEGGTTRIQLYAETGQNSYINSGNLGIGINSPSTKLDVRPTAENPTTGSPAAGSFLQVRADDATVGKGPSLALMNLSGSKETGWRLSALSASGNNGDFTIHGYGGGATYSERLRINSDGFFNFNSANNNNLQGRVTIFDGGNFSTNSILGSGDSDNIYLISDASSGYNVYGSSIAWSRVQYADRRVAAIANVQTSTDEDHVGLAFFTHPSADATAAIEEKFRITHDGIHITNGVSNFYVAFRLANNQSYNWDIAVPNEGGYGNSFRCECGYNHYYTAAYGAHRSAWISSRGTSTNNMFDQDQSHSQSGAWSFSKPNNTTFRVTKSAGSYGGQGYGFVHVRFNYF